MKKYGLFGMLGLALLLSGCAAAQHAGNGAGEEQCAVSAERLGGTLLDSVRQEDYQMFSGVLSGEYAASMTSRDFRASCDNLKKRFGKLVSYQFLTKLETPSVENLVYRVTFERKSAGDEPIVQQMLFRLVAGKIDGRECVIGFGFF